MSASESPCIGVCQLDADNSQCMGCGRTLDEIRNWPSASAADQQAIRVRAAARLALPAQTSKQVSED